MKVRASNSKEKIRALLCAIMCLVALFFLVSCSAIEDRVNPELHHKVDVDVDTYDELKAAFSSDDYPLISFPDISRYEGYPVLGFHYWKWPDAGNILIDMDAYGLSSDPFLQQNKPYGMETVLWGFSVSCSDEHIELETNYEYHGVQIREWINEFEVSEDFGTGVYDIGDFYNRFLYNFNMDGFNYRVHCSYYRLKNQPFNEAIREAAKQEALHLVHSIIDRTEER